MTNEKENNKRALQYAKSLVAFQEVGMGPDENLERVRMIVYEIISVCKDETGIKLDSYPIEFVKTFKEKTK